jgi:AcrR family transcriptional regulator
LSQQNHIAEGHWRHRLTQASERLLPAGAEQKQQRSRTRRSEILKAAVRVFARDGIAGARIADIAAAAGVPVSSVYDYFSDKESVAHALPVDHMAQFFAEFARLAEGKATARERLRLYLWLTVDFARRNHEWARTLYLEIWPSVMMEKADVRRCMDDFSHILMELIHDGERLGEWPVDPAPYQTATIFTGAITQSIVTWLLYRNPRDIMKATGPLADRLISLLNPIEPTAEANGVKTSPRRSREPLAVVAR